ncbi:MAG TPA: VWA domain-containing protein [Candidatus Acidoferrales bacterium]|nr:VWA domain-containing protein [Candidatus Acidoferrales bacterium]
MLAAVFVSLLLVCGLHGQEKSKLPKPQRLGDGAKLRRDARSGELEFRRKAVGAESDSAGSETDNRATLRVGVNLVEVNCTVLSADGTHVRELRREDFRLSEDGVAQTVEHFDASSEAASVALVMDASPSVLRDIGEMKAAARTLARELDAQDEVAVVSFDADAYLLLPFSRDRAALQKAIERVNVARGTTSKRGSNIYEAVYLTAQELFGGRKGRKSIVLLTDGQDSGLGLSWSPASALPQAGDASGRLTFEDVARALAAAGVEVQIISTQARPHGMTDEWLEAQQREMLVTAKAREMGMPHYTLYLAELVRRAGGHLYFLRELETLSDVYHRIAENLRAQYTLGYYPPAGARQPGWRILKVEVPKRADDRVVHRVMYYGPARP